MRVGSRLSLLWFSVCLFTALGVGCTEQKDQNRFNSQGKRFCEDCNGGPLPTATPTPTPTPTPIPNSTGYGFMGTFPASTFMAGQGVYCPLKLSTLFQANVPIESITANNGRKKGYFTFGQAIAGIGSGYRIYDIRNIGSFSPSTVFTVDQPVSGSTTKFYVNETVSQSFTGGAESKANVDSKWEGLYMSCSVNGIDPLDAYGENFPPATEPGVTLKIDLIADASHAACNLFELDGRFYLYIDSTFSNWRVPAYKQNWEAGNLRVDPESGQVNLSDGGCSGDIAGRTMSVSIGSSVRPFSAPEMGATYDSREIPSIAPRIDHVCVTQRADWDAGLMDSDCIGRGTNGSGLNGDMKARTGDVISIFGANFQRTNRAPLCLATEPANCARTRYPLEAKLSVGGVDVARYMGNAFAFVNTADPNDMHNGNCTSDAVHGGGYCDTVHIVVPVIPANHFPLFVGVAAQNPDGARDEYGGPPALGVSGDPADRKIKYYGGVGPDEPADTLAPPPVRIMAAQPSGSDSIDVSFEEVGDDPAGGPNGGMPVSNYDVRRNTSEITSESQFASSTPYPLQLHGNDPAVADASGHLPPWQTVTFSGLTQGQLYCFSAKAQDQAGNVSALRVPAGDGGSGTFCATIPVTPPNTPPCPIVLSVESGGDPTTEIRLSWVEVSENGDSSEGACVPSGGAVSSLDLKYRPGGTDFSDADFISGTGMTVIAQEDDGSTLAPKAPGLVHQRLLQGLTPATTYIFAIRSMDPQGLRSPVSNHASFSTDPVVVNLVGNGQFVNLRENLPMSPGSVQRLSINVENSVNILPDLMGGHPWILLADPSNGVQILKVADAYNVSCLDRFGVLDPVCALNVDIEPRDWMSPARWVGDGQPDFIDRDRHILRTGSADCDGVNAVQQNSPSTADWSRVDTFVRCNLPKDPVYAENIYKAAMVAVRAVNNDPYDDLVLANLSALQVPDAVYINSGQDLCPTRPLGGADVADGIPCFSPPIKLPPQLANSKLPSSRVKLYDAVDNDGGADLILVMTGRQEIGGFSAYSNHCKSRTGSCQADDFRLETGLFDVGGDNSLLPLYCEDVLFVDLNNDDVNDVLCVRSESFTSPNNHGLNLTFRASRPSANADGLPHFVLDPNLFPAATLDNCNHSFATSARGGNGQDYLLVGYRKLGGGSAGRGIACKTRLFAGSGNSFSDIALPGMNNNDNCLNGALADSRGLGRIDAVIACGQLEDISSDFGGDTSFRGAKILLNGGINLGIGGSDLGMNVFQNFEANGIRLYQPQFNAVTGEPTQLPGAPIVFDFDAGLPGAVNAIGLGDLNNDGVPDVYFGNGGTSIGEAGIDLIFRQMSR